VLAILAEQIADFRDDLASRGFGIDNGLKAMDEAVGALFPVINHQHIHLH
jgi:hypothetical protein